MSSKQSRAVAVAVIASIAGIAAVSSGTATAAPQAPPVTAVMRNHPGYARVTRKIARRIATDAARRFPPAADCHGRVRVTFNALDLPRNPDTGLRYNGSANVETCRIRVARARSLVAVCVVVAHEMGHLHGLEHHASPWHVMYATPRFVDLRCVRLVRRLGGVQR